MRFLFGAAMSAMFAAGAASAADLELPKQLAWTAYGTSSAGYNQSVAIGAALKEAAGINLRILPGKNDIARMEPLRQGKVQFSANGIGLYLAQEGVFAFGGENWGPQAVRMLSANNGGRVGLTIGVAAEACEKAGKPSCDGFTHADMKGLNVAYIKGAPALNVNMQAQLAFGDLTWDDVNRVEFGGFAASWKGMVDGSVDVAFASTNSGRAYEAASGPRGVYWPPMDPNNTAAMNRMLSVAPYYTMINAVVGANIDGTDGVPTSGYAYPVLMTYETQDVDVTYNMTKAMFELYDGYKDNAPGINGWSLDKQNYTWVVPYHEGAVRYYKEIGVWSGEAQAHNDNLIARQAALKAAWDELKAEAPADWAAAWGAKRRAALEAGGFSIVF